MSVRPSRWLVPFTIMTLTATAVSVSQLVAPGAATAATTTTFAAAADTYVENGSAANTNFGGSAQIVADNSPARRIFLKFEITGVSGTVSSAKLRLHVRNVADAGSPAGGTAFRVGAAAWSENSVTWNTQPTAEPKALSSLGAVARNTWYELDVTPAVTGAGT